MKKILVLSVFILAVVLRFWHLGQNPPSLDWDEASLGYNAFSILHTGRDEYGTFLPLSIRSFGDYKPALYVYLTVLPVSMFGLNEFSVRFASAFMGSVAVIATYFLLRNLFLSEKNRLILFATFFLAISPWHIQFSRVAFEANVALTLVILGVLFFVIGLRRSIYFLPSCAFLAASLYAYHSPRLIVPLLLVGIILYGKKFFGLRIRKGISIFAAFLILILPVAYQTFQTSARFGSVSLLGPSRELDSNIEQIGYDKAQNDPLGMLVHNRRVVYSKNILSAYLDHFNLDFLFITGDAPGRHHAADMGMLYLFDFPLLVVGLSILIRSNNRNKYLVFLWFLLAPVASSLTTGTPHAVRAIFYLPTYQIVSGVGLFEIWSRIRKRKLCAAIFCCLIALITTNFYYYLHMYWIHSPTEYSQWWQYGYKELVADVGKIESKYDRVIVTYKYDQPYIFFLFYNKVDPQWYQSLNGTTQIERSKRSFGKYEFRFLDWNADKSLSNTLLVGSPEEVPEDASGIIKEINFLDGSVAFRLRAM